jgi:phenylalanyl-tRNA synthetase beta chain
LLETLDVRPMKAIAGGPMYFHPFRVARVDIEEVPAGFFGQLHPDLVAEAEVKRPVFAFELDLDVLSHLIKAVPTITAPARVPASRRDIALVVPNDVTHDQLQEIIRANGGQLLENAVCFDVFVGGTIPEGRRSIAFALIFRAADRTLSTEEVQALQERIVRALIERAGAELRS